MNRSSCLPAIGEKRRAQVDVKTLVREAISRLGKIGSDLSLDADAYDLVHVNFGWEMIGHWESELVLSDISVRAFPGETSLQGRGESDQ